LIAALAQAAMQTLPMCRFEALFGAAPLLILAPHPDDETLGCGGTIAEACARGHEVHVAVLTDGSMSHPRSRSWPPTRLVARRKAEARTATAILGLSPDRIRFLGEQDTKAPHDGPAFEALLDRLCSLIREHRIGTICASWDGDPHCDHAAAAKLAAAAGRRSGARQLAYPVWGWTVAPDAELPQVATGGRLDVARHLPQKRRAVAAHATQYSDLIDDDPDGFRLAPEFLALFDRPWEVFLDPP
jgi:LmbE family N-acetylglucosaminyl deacetylase